MRPALACACSAFVVLLARPAGADGEAERALDAMSIPTERSPSPKLQEWSSALRVRPTRTSPRVSCRSEVVREWLRVRCAGEAFAISLLGGDVEGIAFWIDPVSHEGEVLMPLRRGGRHVFQLWKATKDGASAFTPEPMLVVQEHWLEGATAPTLTIL